MTYCKRIIAWLVFLAGLLGLLMIASRIFIPKNNDSLSGMEQERANGILAEAPNSIDILVLGDSEAYTSFSPLLLWKDTSYTSYTCGTNSQRLPYTKTMLERALENQRPKLVILETLAIYRPIQLDAMASDEVAKYLPIVRYHDRWKNLHWNDFTTAPVTATEQAPYKGHTHNETVDPCLNVDYMAPTQEPAATIPLVNQYYVKAIQELCEDYGAQFMLLSTPSPVNWNYARHAGIEAFAQELGCDYLDLNLEDVKIDWTQDTFDKGDHLNHFGAVKVTKFLSNYLRGKDGLTDHRSDPAYGDWNEKLKAYENLISQ